MMMILPRCEPLSKYLRAWGAFSKPNARSMTGRTHEQVAIVERGRAQPHQHLPNHRLLNFGQPQSLGAQIVARYSCAPTGLGAQQSRMCWHCFMRPVCDHGSHARQSKYLRACTILWLGTWYVPGNLALDSEARVRIEASARLERKSSSVRRSSSRCDHGSQSSIAHKSNRLQRMIHARYWKCGLLTGSPQSH